MASINQAQAKALAEGFLNNIGSNPEYSDFVPSHTLKALISLAGIIITEAEANLDKGGHRSSGNLASSLKIMDPQKDARDIVLDIEALEYFKFLNKGVKGTKGGSGQYAFKTSFPSKKMVSSIRDWMKRAGIVDSFKLKPISNVERKNRSISQLDSAYVIARSIKMKGIKKTGFFDKAIQKGQQFADSELGAALRVDIIESLPDKL